MASGFFKAMRLLTILPFPADRESPSASILIYFPVVGLVVGLVLAGFDRLLIHTPAPVSAFLLVAAWLLLTRGLHIDGVSDTADALLAVCEPSRRLEIMKDPHVGPMGAAAVLLVILGKTIALTEIAAGPHFSSRLPAIVLAAVAARWVVVLACSLFSYPRLEGLGATYIGAAKIWHVVTATVLTFGISCILWPVSALILLPLGGCVGLGLALCANRALGGITGDVLGAIVEVSETAVLLGCASLARVPSPLL